MGDEFRVWHNVQSMAGGGKQTLIDLSHTVEHGLVTYKGLPAPIICDYLSREASRKHYAPGTEFQIGKIEMVANTGTYLDSPFHRYAGGTDRAGPPLEKLAGPDAVVLRADPVRGRRIGAIPFPGLCVAGHAGMLQTRWASPWRIV